jgi:hypothetical protein
LAAEDILLEGSHGDIAIWPSNRGEVAPDASLGDTAVEYLLGDVVAAVLSFVAGEAWSDVRDGQFLLEWPGYCSKKAYRTQAIRSYHRKRLARL